MPETLDSRTLRKVEIAKERGSRVMLVRTPEAHMILDIVRFADRGIRNLRNRLLLTLEPEEVLPLLRSYKEAVVRLHETAKAICEKAGIPYNPPSRTLRAIVAEELEEAGTDKNGDGSGTPITP